MDASTVKEYIRQTGQRGKEIFRVVQELRPVIDVLIEKGDGAKILEEDVERHMELFQEIYASLIKDGKAEQSKVIELQYLHNRLVRLSRKLKTYEDGVNEINSKGEKQ
jgi:uncharacterized protein YacL